MSLEIAREEVVRKRPTTPQLDTYLGVIKDISDMRKLMRKRNFEFPIVVRFCPENLRDQRSVRRADEVFALLTEAKRQSGKAEGGKKLFAYRAFVSPRLPFKSGKKIKR